MSIKIAVNGAAGRMGRHVCSLIMADQNLELSCAAEHASNPDVGRDVGELAGAGHANIPITDSLSGECDAVIDFSLPEGTVIAAKFACEMGAAFVTGATGLGPEQRAEIENTACRSAVLHAPNFSLGVNLLFKMAGQVAQALGPGYDIEIIEAHHNQKMDAPSGTALGLGESITKGLNRCPREGYVHGREGNVGARGAKEIGFHAVRGGDIVGEHTVMFAGPGERVEITHKAHTRLTFAHGAVRAACYLVGKPAGRYAMSDVLGL